MKITSRKLEKVFACRNGINLFKQTFPLGGEYQEVIDRCRDLGKYDYAEWLIGTFEATEEVLELEELSDTCLYFAGGVKVKGNLTLTRSLCVGGDLEVGGDLYSTRGVRVLGSIKVAGSIHAPKGEIDSRGNVDVGKNVIGRNSVVVKGFLKVQGNLSTSGWVTSGAWVSVGGNIKAVGPVNATQYVHCRGEIDAENVPERLRRREE